MTLISVSLDYKICPVCGIHYAVDGEFMALKLERGGKWYCPNGHNLVFIETTADKLRKRLEEERKKNADQRESINYFSGRLTEVSKERDSATRNWKSTRTRLRKTKTRIANGVCPCCNRSFANIAAHMKTKHPKYVEEIEK